MAVLTAERPARWGRLAVDAASMVGLVMALAVGHAAASDGFAYDAHAYWLAQPYGQAPNTPDAFLYSPPALLIAQAFGALPWPVFLEAYTAAIAVGVWVLAGPLTAILVWTPQVASELTLGNIHVFLALVAVFGLRWPGLWAFALLTKVTPGIGLLWFVARAEWRKLAIALGVTAAIAAPTLVLAPALWGDWFAVLASPSGNIGAPLPLRLVLAATVIVVGARRDWPWVVPVGAMLALPILWDVHGISMLLGVVWWMRRR